MEGSLLASGKKWKIQELITGDRVIRPNVLHQITLEALGMGLGLRTIMVLVCTSFIQFTFIGVAILFTLLLEGVVWAVATVDGVVDLRPSLFLADFGVDFGVATFLGVELFSLPDKVVLGVIFTCSP